MEHNELNSKILELELQKRLLLRAMRCVLNSMEKYDDLNPTKNDLIRSVLAEAIKQNEKKND